jgi:hypothetical protein
MEYPSERRKARVEPGATGRIEDKVTLEATVKDRTSFKE